MLSRRVFGFHSYLHLLKVNYYCQRSRQYFAISNDTVTSTPPHDDEGDFFGITENDLSNKSQICLSDGSSEDDFSKEVILTKHLSKDVKKNDLEKYVNTKFGKIRFDWQNTVPSKVGEISSYKIKESQEQSNSDVDYFSEMYFQHNLSETFKNSPVVDSPTSTVTVKKIEDINPKFTPKEEDMNFINCQYFGNHEENIVENSNPDEETFPHDDHFQRFSLKKNSSSNYEDDFTHDYNVIESQYFPNPSACKSDVKPSTNNTFKTNFPGATENNLDITKSSDSFDNNTRSTNPESSQSREQKDRASKHSFTNNSKYENAFEASQDIRREIKSKNERLRVDSKGFRILKDQVNDLSQLTTYEIANHLKSRILYNKNDLIVINKPYGLPSHGGPGVNVNIAKSLSELAKKIHHDGEIHLIHRLDKETTGVMLLAKTDKMASLLKNMFKERQVIKTYWALTKGIPNPSRGIIDIPIAEGNVDGKHRMVLKPEIAFLKKSKMKSHQAITHYKVINSSCNCALIECKAETGVKHQVRVHLAFGLNTPILGDHKYSHLTKMAPQRLFPEILEHLHIRQSKVRHVPMHLHAVSIIVPEVINGKNLSFKAPLPYNFCNNMKSLKFRKSNKLDSK